MKFFIYSLITTSFLFLSTLSYAQKPPLILETDWLNSSVGSKGDILGAKVTDVDKVLSKDITILEISLPIENPENFDKIEVFGKNSTQPIPQSGEPVWIEDSETGNQGLRLYLKKKPGFEFRLRLIDNEEGRHGVRNYQ